jgi:TolA-binding protein
MKHQAAIQTRRAGMCVVMVVAIAVGGSSLAQETRPQQDGPDPILRDYLSANGLLNRGLHELAMAEYRKFLEVHSDHEKAPLARYGLGVALFRLKRIDDALAELEASISPPTPSFPYVVEVAVLRAQILLEQGRHANAADALTPVLKDHADHDLADDATALLAEAHYRGGNFAAATQTCQSFAQRWPKHVLIERVFLFHGLSLAAAGDDAGAIEALENLIRQFPEGNHSGRASLALAQSLQRLGRMDDAAARYRYAIDQRDEATAPDAMLGLATLMLGQEQAAEAEKVVDDWLNRFPDHALAGQAHMIRGRALLNQQHSSQAIDAFTVAGEHDPAQRDAAEFWISKCELRGGRNAEAAQRLLAAIKAHPESPLLAEMHHDRAVALMRAGDREAAARAFDGFRKRFVSHPLAPQALHMQAALEHDMEHHDESIRLCREFLGLHPDHGLASAVEFLWAEDQLFAGRLAEAARRFEAFIQRRPNDERVAMARLRMGAALHQLERFDESHSALAPLAEDPAAAPHTRAALLLLGDIAFRRSQWSQSVDFLTRTMTMALDGSGIDEALLKRSLANARLGHENEALGDLATLINEHRGSEHRVQAIFERGQLLMARNDDDGAQADFEAVVKLGESSRFAAYAFNHLAAIARRQGRHDDAAALLTRAMAASSDASLTADVMFQQGLAHLAARQYEQASTTFAAFIEAYPSHALRHSARVHRMIALSRLGREDAALEMYDELGEPAMADLDANVRIAVLYERAWCLRGTGRTDDATEVYRALLKGDPKSPLTVHATVEFAELRAEAGAFEEAVEWLDPLLASADRTLLASEADIHERALYRLAACQYQLKQFDKAAAAGQEFVKMFPASALAPSAHALAGESLLSLGRHAQAARHFRDIVEHHSTDPTCPSSLLRLGECLAATGDWSGSHRAFTQHMERFSDSELSFQAQFGQAWALENQGRHDEAIAAYQKVVDSHLGPTAARAQFQIGECLFAQEKHAEAVREFLKVDILYAYPEWSAAALYEAGRCLEAISETAQARAQFEQVRDKFGDTKWAKLAVERLATGAGSRETVGHTP